MEDAGGFLQYPTRRPEEHRPVDRRLRLEYCESGLSCTAVTTGISNV